MSLDREFTQLQARLRASLDELGVLQEKVRSNNAERGDLRADLRAQWHEIRDEWDDIHAKWWIGVLAVLVAFFLGSYLFYMNLGWYADQRVLPASSDWFLDQLPTLNLIPLLTWGWLALHAYGLGSAVLYSPRRIPFLLFLLGVYLFVRTVYVFLSPIGAPLRIVDMAEFDTLFSQVVGVYTFQNEFIFSGHTAIPFMFALFLDTRVQKTIMGVGSVVMAVGVLLTHNHYTVDVLSAYFMGYSIYALSRGMFEGWVRPLFLKHRERLPRNGADAALPAPMAGAGAHS